MRSVLVTLRKALSDAETGVMEEDWSERMDHIKTARAASKRHAETSSVHCYRP